MEDLIVVRDKFPIGKKFRSFVYFLSNTTYWDMEVVGVKYHPEGKPWVQFRTRKEGNTEWMEDDGALYESLLINIKEGTLIEVDSFENEIVPSNEEPFSKEGALSFDYRIVKTKTDYDGILFDEFKVIEVYYDKEGNIINWSDISDTALIQNSYEELKENYNKMKHAFEKPILRFVNSILVEIN